jgi:hypothetical protein
MIYDLPCAFERLHLPIPGGPISERCVHDVTPTIYPESQTEPGESKFFNGNLA